MPRIKLTDKQKKKIIADYISNTNYSETARMNNVHASTVKRLIDSGYDKDLQEKAEHKKEENTKEILEYLDTIADKQKEIIELSMKVLVDKLSKPDAFTNIKDVATVYGVIYDKAIKSKELKIKQADIQYKNNSSKETLEKLDKLLEEQQNAYMD